MAPHSVQCVKLQKDASGIDPDALHGQIALDRVESVGGKALRQRVYDNVSWEARELGKARLTMLLNEYRLNMTDLQTDTFIRQQMEDFFFGEPTAPPPGYVSPTGKGT